MPITTHVALLSGAAHRPLGAYLASLASGAADPPGILAVGVSPDQLTSGDPGPRGAGALAPDGADHEAADDLARSGLLPMSLTDLAAAFRFTGQAGESLPVPVTLAGHPVRVLLLGVGDRSPRALRRAGAELGRQISGGTSATASVVSGEAPGAVEAFATGVLLGGYRFSLTSGDDPPPAPALARLLAGSAIPVGADPAGADPAGAGSGVAGSDHGPAAPPGDTPVAAAVDRAGVVAGAVALARDLANTPSLRKSPPWLADEAVAATAGQQVTARVWSAADLTRDGFGGILAVGAGSSRPPRLIELSYRPPGATMHTVLVGKGITFDSGGLSLKPNDNMKLMKTDMAGGAVVIAVLSALARLGVTQRVTGLIAAAENMPSGSAYRPGDVITHYGGRTVEVFNTDAEGRLVLADALAYAAQMLAPDQMIDIATLTGAARIALGSSHAPLYATDDALADALLAAGRTSGDQLWRMPLEDSYATALTSSVADLSHVAVNGLPAGSITAALFLREFSGGRPWAHLDIAGPGRSAEDRGELSRGATGFGVRLLLDLLSPARG